MASYSDKKSSSRSDPESRTISRWGIVHTLMILYAKEEGQINLVLWQGQLLGQLGETPQKDMEIPAEETNDLLSYWYETDLEEVICDT